MIITQKKDFKELLDSLGEKGSVVVLGCSECAAMSKTGGEEEVFGMAKLLSENGKKVLAGMVLTTPCNDLVTKKELRSLKESLEAADAVVCLACGNGVQTVQKFTAVPVLPGTDTVFVGERIRSGVFEENCRTCGECVLGRTAAICPVSRCAKGLLNGACGGSTNGKCETDPDMDCAWVLIYQRLKGMGRLDLLEEVQPIRGYAQSSRPRKLNLRKKGQ